MSRWRAVRIYRLICWCVRRPGSANSPTTSTSCSRTMSYRSFRGHEISKGGRSVIHDSSTAFSSAYGKEADVVLAGLNDYVRSLPLAARLANRIFLSHSLPDLLSIGLFDLTVFSRELSEHDLEPGGSAYGLVWGRYHSPQLLDLLAQRLDVDLFITGHMPQEMGYAVIGRMIILASEHSHGTFLPIDLSRDYSARRAGAQDSQIRGS